MSSPDLAGGTDCRSRDYRWWCMNYGQECPVHQQDVVRSFAALFYTSLLLLIALFLISFSSILSPYHSFTQFSPHYLCSCSNISYYCPYTSLSSHHSCVLILTCFIVFPVSSCSLFSHFISRLLTDISRLPITHSQITAVDNYQVKIQQFLRYY